MDSFSNALWSPTWWASVVVVGIAINLVSAYLKPGLDRLMSSLSSAWGARSARASAAYEAEIAALKKDVHLQEHYKYRQISLQLSALLYGVLTALLLLVQVIVSLQPEWSSAQWFGWHFPRGLYYAIVAIVFMISIQTNARAQTIQLKLSVARRVTGNT